MDRLFNPYAPGAGTPPPELAGRDELLEQASLALERIRRRLHAKSLLMVGLRGVGKTVLLDRMRDTAAGAGMVTLRIEAPENRSLPGLLAPPLRLALLQLSRHEQAKELARRALRGLAGFVGAFKVRYDDVELSVDLEPEPGLADSGDLEHDLQSLLEAVGEAARTAGTVLAIFIDEMQYVREPELAALITALHRAAQRQLPVALVGAGLPQLPGRLGRAKSYAERLFDFVEVGSLPPEAASKAIVNPARNAGVDFEPEAVDRIIHVTKGYPYFLQEWGKHVWDVAPESPITVRDVEQATGLAVAALDASFFRVRFDRLTPSEKRYLRAMAELGPGPHRSGSIAEVLGRSVNSFGPTRAKLIEKGMIWSPAHGDTAFTVPLFDGFMRRVMPGDDWRA
jgi:hypothetical protein